MASKFPKIIIDRSSLKENLNKIHEKLKKSPEGVILQSSSKDNDLKLCRAFLHLLYNENRCEEGRFKIYNDKGNPKFRVILSKKVAPC